MSCDNTSSITNADLTEAENRMRRDITSSIEPLCQRISDLVQKQSETNEQLQKTNTQVALMLKEMSYSIERMATLDKDLRTIDSHVGEIDVQIARMEARQEGILAVVNRLAVPVLIVVFSAYLAWSSSDHKPSPEPAGKQHNVH